MRSQTSRCSFLRQNTCRCVLSWFKFNMLLFVSWLYKLVIQSTELLVPCGEDGFHYAPMNMHMNYRESFHVSWSSIEKQGCVPFFSLVNHYCISLRQPVFFKLYSWSLFLMKTGSHLTGCCIAHVCRPHNQAVADLKPTVVERGMCELWHNCFSFHFQKHICEKHLCFVGELSTSNDHQH